MHRVVGELHRIPVVQDTGQYRIYMLKLVAPTIEGNYQIETGARRASLSKSNSDRDNKRNWSICGGEI